MDQSPEVPLPGWSPLRMRTGRLDAPRAGREPVEADARDRARAVAEDVARGTVVVGGRTFVSSLEIVAGASRQASKRLRLRILDVHGLWRHPYHFDRISPRTALAPFLPLRTVADDPDLSARLFGADPLARHVADVFRLSDPRAADADATCYSAALSTLAACNELRDVRGTRFGESVRDALRYLRRLIRVYEDWTSDVPDPASVAASIEAVRDAFADEGTAYGNHAAHRLTKDGERFRAWWDVRGRLAARSGTEDADDAAAFGSFAL